jgi:hypothetical protein
MEIRRPVAALMTALALFGGGAALTGCGAQEGGTGTPDPVDTQRLEKTHDDLPDNSDREQTDETENSG